MIRRAARAPKGTGLACAAPLPYFRPMGFFSRMSPVRAYKDLRVFLATRQPYELGFLALAMLVTGFFVYAFAHDSYEEPAYKRNIVYVQQWTLDRTDAQIRAQQAIDGPIKAAQLKAQAEREAKNRAAFKKLDDRLTKYGL